MLVRCKRPSRRMWRAGFTLIELLVVVSIIALLVSILLPSLSEAREAGKRTVCLTNERQIGTAMGSYFNDYSDIFPWVSHNEYLYDNKTNQSWFYGGRYPTIVVSNVLEQDRYFPEERPLNDYLYPNAIGPKAETKLFKCPSEDGVRWVDMSGYYLHDPRLAYDTTGVSYTGNWWWYYLGGVTLGRAGSGGLGVLPDYGNQLTKYKLNVRGSATFGVNYGDPLDTMLTQKTRWRGWHRKLGFSEMMFLDGHADFLFTDTQGAPGTGEGKLYGTEWTLWFNIPVGKIPEQFIQPFPGIEEYICPY